MAEHLHNEFTSRGMAEDSHNFSVKEFLLLFLLELMTNLNNEACEKFCLQNLLLWRLHECELLSQLVTKWLEQSELGHKFSVNAPEISSMTHLYLHQFQSTTTMFWLLAPISKIGKYAKLPSLTISAKTLPGVGGEGETRGSEGHR